MHTINSIDSRARTHTHENFTQNDAFFRPNKSTDNEQKGTHTQCEIESDAERKNIVCVYM